MKAVDTNLLVYCVSARSSEQDTALQTLRKLAEGSAPWAIPWSCIYEFLRVTTHPKVLDPPLSMKQALVFVDALLKSPSLLLLSETDGHAAWLAKAVGEGGVGGNLVYDARIAALCYEHGVDTLLTADADFLRFRGLRVVNPFRS